MFLLQHIRTQLGKSLFQFFEHLQEEDGQSGDVIAIDMAVNSGSSNKSKFTVVFNKVRVIAGHDVKKSIITVTAEVGDCMFNGFFRESLSFVKK
jgi:hypothetical protein